MSTWLQAHRMANLSAAQAHGDLGVDPSRFPIDVYGAIEAADVLLMWRPLPRAFGMYVDSPGSRPGILLNNRLEPAVQRHTAAHELGHHYLGHGSRVDIDLDPFSTPRRGWTDIEKAAEAFAVWFLMPRRAARAALAQMDLERPCEPEHVYQLSLLLGTSYRSTARHLVNLRLAGDRQARDWMAVPSNRIKQRLDPAQRPTSRAPDVWVVNRRFAGTTLTAGAGDRFVIDPGGAPGTLRLSGDLTAVVPLRSSVADAVSERLVTEISSSADGPVEVVIGPPEHAQSWVFGANVEQPRSGIAGIHQNRPADAMRVTATQDEEPRS